MGETLAATCSGTALWASDGRSEATRARADEHGLVEMATVPGFETAVFPFTTDIPFLSAWGTPLLFGPGSVLAAHTADEHVRVDELRAAVGHYAQIALTLLER